jgi:hypothetical protein
VSDASDGLSMHVHLTIQKWANEEDHAAKLPPDEIDEFDYEETQCS